MSTKRRFDIVTDACHGLTATVFQAQRCYNRGDRQASIVVLQGLMESIRTLGHHIHNERLQEEAKAKEQTL